MHTGEKLKLQLHKKTRGMLDDFLPIVVFVLLIAVMLFTFIGFNTAVNKKTAINQVAREYILKMEQVGYMNGEIQNSLLQRLKDLGYYGDETGSEITADIINDATTTLDVGYGSDICLSFTVYTTNKLLRTDDGSGTWNLFSPKFEDSDYVPITITYYSTSKK